MEWEKTEEKQEANSVISKNTNFTNWPITVDNDLIQNCLVQDIVFFFQNKKTDDTSIKSSRIYKEQNRSFSNKYFEKRLKNSQTVIRYWLVYSKSKGCICCFVWELFSKCQTLITTGRFSDWMNVLRTLENQKDNMEHKKAMLCWITRKSNKNTVDQQLEEQMRKKHTVLFWSTEKSCSCYKVFKWQRFGI